mgnify:CR=1 FL=1
MRMPMVLRTVALGLALTELCIPRASEGTAGAVNIVSHRYVIPGYDEPNTPPNVPISDALRAALTDPAVIRDGRVNLNQTGYVRFFDGNRARPPEAIVILVPGPIGGANAFRFLATEVVRRSGGAIEVWALDRRANLLEDLLPLWRAERMGTVEAALEALAQITEHPDGRGGYIANHYEEVGRFMSEWGLDVHVRDVKAVVEEARKIAGARIVLGGHSLGAILAQAFAAYDFEGVPGYRLIHGVILLDGTGIPGMSPLITDEQYLAGLDALRSPTRPEDAPFALHPFGPYHFQLLEIAALLALVDPDGPSPLDRYAPELIAAPMTNAAALGVILDDEFQPQPLARFSIGFLHIPPDNPLASIATRSRDPSSVNPNGLYAPKDLGEKRQQWAAVPDLRRLDSTFLHGPEPSDFSRVARLLLTGSGRGSSDEALARELFPDAPEANFLEWYFPRRLLLDLLRFSDLDATRLSPAIIAALTARGGRVPTLTENRRMNLPVLAIQARQGLFPPLAGSLPFTRYKNSTRTPQFTYSLLPNSAHGDLLTGTDQDARGQTAADLIVSFAVGNRLR